MKEYNTDTDSLFCLQTDFLTGASQYSFQQMKDYNTDALFYLQTDFLMGMQYTFQQVKDYDSDTDSLFCLQTDFLTGRQYTFQQVKDYTRRVASALHKHGFKKGDVIATSTINLPEFSILVLAAASLGVIVSPANPTYTSGQ